MKERLREELAILDSCARLYGECEKLYTMFGEVCSYFGTEVVCEAFNKVEHPDLWEIFNKNI